MKNVVITGSTRGIGRGLAEEFLKHGCAVVVCGRSQHTLQGTTEALAQVFGEERVLGQMCDVGAEEQVQQLWDTAIQRFGKVDIWINNAGLNHSSLPFWEQDADKIQQVLHANLLGVIHGTQIAYRGMLKQGSGFIYNMEGMGSSGPAVKGTAFYASSKSAVTKFTQIAILDAKDGPVKIGYLSPGMVVTDLLVNEDRRKSGSWERTKRVYNILADKVETVAPYLAEKVLGNDKHGARFAWLTPGKSAIRFLQSPFLKRDLFPDE